MLRKHSYSVNELRRRKFVELKLVSIDQSFDGNMALQDPCEKLNKTTNISKVCVKKRTSPTPATYTADSLRFPSSWCGVLDVLFLFSPLVSSLAVSSLSSSRDDCLRARPCSISSVARRNSSRLASE